MTKIKLKYFFAAFLLLTFVGGTIIPVLSKAAKESKGLYGQHDQTESNPADSRMPGEVESNDLLNENSKIVQDLLVFDQHVRKYRVAGSFYAQTYFIPVITPPPDNL
jgi:hypothetical protein